MKFTREKLEELRKLTREVNEAKNLASELLRTAKDRKGETLQKLIREGKEIEVKENVLWDEVFYLGVASQAGEILKKEHPEVFDAYDKQEKAAVALKIFTVGELGVDYTAMTLSDYMSMTEKLVKLIIEEENNKKQ